MAEGEGFDAVIVGSGVNSLTCAALLARAEWRVCVLERNDWFGGAIKTEELTEAGFLHDVFSAWHPLWVGGAAHAELGDELAACGLEYLNTELPSATAFPDGGAAFLLRSAEGNAEELGPEWPGVLEHFFPNADLAFGVLGTELWSPAGIAVAVQEGGMPVPRGGSAKLADALVQLIRDHGGVCETDRDVERVLVRSGRAVGVRLTDGETIEAERAVVASVTPTQLHERLLADVDVPAPVAEGARRFRYGRSAMQIHYALSEPPRWDGDERLARTAIVHVTPGLDGVSRAVNEAERGLLPDEGTIVVGQPLTLDPSRAPDGRGLLWIQLQELPWRIKGHASSVPYVGNGEWTDELRERYADRIQARLARHIPNLESSILRRVALGPHDLQRANVNLRHGDPYGGSLALDQNFLWRPFGSSPGHTTPVERLWQIGASTWPGPGLGAGSGTIVARKLLEPPLTQRAVARARALGSWRAHTS